MTSLITGWEPEVAVGDTLLRRFLENLIAQNESIVRSVGGWCHRDDYVAITDAERPLAFFNAAVPTQPPSDWRELMERLSIAFGYGSGPAYLWSAWPTPDLSEFGWTKVGHPPFLVRPPSPVDVVAEADIRVERVTTRTELERWERVAIDGFSSLGTTGADAGPLFDPSLLRDERFRFFYTSDHQQPVAVAAQFVAAGMASCAFGVTLPEFRSRGHWRALLAARLQHEPEIPACGVFNDNSRRGAEAAGFLPIQRLTLWSLDRQPRATNRKRRQP